MSIQSHQYRFNKSAENRFQTSPESYDHFYAGKWRHQNHLLQNVTSRHKELYKPFVKFRFLNGPVIVCYTDKYKRK